MKRVILAMVLAAIAGFANAAPTKDDVKAEMVTCNEIFKEAPKKAPNIDKYKEGFINGCVSARLTDYDDVTIVIALKKGSDSYSYKKGVTDGVVLGREF